MAKHLTKKQREAQIASLYSKKAARKEGSRDLIYSYLIVCEGTKSEPNYLRHFVSRRTKVIGADRSTMKLVEETLRRRDLGTYDQVWLVFDKDDNEDFNEAILAAKKNNFEVAWSNESFELWLCLHFIDLKSAVSRNQYIEILEREIRKYNPTFTYDKGADVMYDLLSAYGDENAAKRRASELRSQYQGQDYNSHNPCTTLDLLVNLLESNGTKLGNH